MKLKMNLLENAHDFINSSLTYYSYAEDNERMWKIAFINIVQALELMAKEKLRRVNNFLVYENIDNPKNTISLSIALDRLIKILEIELDPKDIANIKKAIQLRNQMMHYEIEYSVHELKAKYCRLFEFATSFHTRFLDSELHAFIYEDLWEIEADLMTYFRSRLILYNSEEVAPKFVREMLDAQYIIEYIIAGEVFPRIKYGDEPDKRHSRGRCEDCAVNHGEYHVPGCDWERCPKCLGQAISCGCDDVGEREESAADGIQVQVNT
ncbi:hypothetical protein [Paenibacillus sp. S-12]|uniref:hypothetical protein n=1 Tax=Paenibacillus sp. S-12 TaxID=3031371 RepID=UPI0025A27270|nr:hypothetical protein [Paenibacillus sp. S-12]